MNSATKWFGAVAPDTLDIPTCPCGHQEFEQAGGYYFCGQCHRSFTFDPQEHRWVEREPQDDDSEVVCEA
jgi:hypothetical protein